MRFETTTDVTVYVDQEDGYAGDPHRVVAGTPIWAAVNHNETRKLDGQIVPVVLLEVAGSVTWCWMPRNDFSRSTRRVSGASRLEAETPEPVGARPAGPIVPEFDPVEIAGECLSQTMVRDRKR